MESTLHPPGPLDARDFQYGDLRSLYHTLDPHVVDRLEDAVLSCCFRDFEPAMAIFDSFGVELRHHPVIAYQHSQVYWMQWSHFKGAQILKEALAAANQFQSLFPQPDVYILLRLCYGTVQFNTEGNLTLARDAMHELRSRLSNVPVHEYTDVQVHTMWALPTITS